MDDQFDEQPTQYTAEQFPDDAVRAKLNEGDEGYPPIEVSAWDLVLECPANEIKLRHAGAWMWDG